MMGLSNGRKKFSDTFSRFDTIPAVTDSRPASHVAIAITLNAKASSLKKAIRKRLHQGNEYQNKDKLTKQAKKLQKLVPLIN